MKAELTDSPLPQSMDTLSSSMTNKAVMTFLHQLSGQEKKVDITDIDHSYAKPWNKHPDVQIRARPAKFLFMKDFPKHFLQRYSMTESDNIDIVTVDSVPTLALLNDPMAKMGQSECDSMSNELPPPPKTGWTIQMNKLWTKAMKILHSDRLAKLTYDGRVNESILKRNLLDRSANKFRHLFATIASWDINLLIWLHKTLCEYVGSHFIGAYHDCMHILRLKIPNLIDSFYVPLKCETPSRVKQQMSDPIQTMLNNYKPKRINGSPLFLIVPNGPQIPHQMTLQRMKHWHNLFGSLGKVITISVHSRPNEKVFDCLNDIRYAVRDKIKECKSTFNEGRPLVLVGFGHSSLIAAHCALDNYQIVNATICLGFPLTAINGFRGDLDDPLLETTVPTLFIIGQNSSLATLDDMEDFRERITKTETGLIVIGGANDRLIVSSIKKKFDGITQSIVDRCIADEVHDFVSSVLNPSSYDHFVTPSASSRSIYGFPKSGASNSPSRSSPQKPKRKRPPRDRERSVSRPRPKRPRPARPRPAQRSAQHSSGTGDVQSPTTATPLTNTEVPSPNALKPPIVTPELLRVQLEKTETARTEHSQITPIKLAKPYNDQLSQSNTEQSDASSVISTDPALQLTPQTPKIDRIHHGVSYEISEMPTVISQSASRSGRQIRAPKSLDV